MYCTYVTYGPTGRYYVGKGNVKSIAKGYKGSGAALHKAFKKHPKELWMIDIIQTYETEDEAYEAEGKLIDDDLLSDPLNLNLMKGGRGCFPPLSIVGGTKIRVKRVNSEESKKKMSKAQLARYEQKPVAAETRAKMAASAKTRPPIAESTRKLISENTKKLNAARIYGPASDETKRKMSEAHKLKFQLDPTAREKCKGMSGKKHSPETVARMKEAAFKRWAKARGEE